MLNKSFWSLKHKKKWPTKNSLVRELRKSIFSWYLLRVVVVVYDFLLIIVDCSKIYESQTIGQNGGTVVAQVENDYDVLFGGVGLGIILCILS